MNLSIRDPVNRLWKRCKELPEFVKVAMVSILFVGAISWLALIFGWVDVKLMDFSKNHMKEQTFGSAFRLMVIQGPIREELGTRGPAFILMMLLICGAKLMKWWNDKESLLEYKFFGKIPVIDCAVWPMLLYTTTTGRWITLYPSPSSLLDW
ncbi:MAG: hypothetical protein AAB345_00920 [Patescibacteria group bacterium]